MFNVSLDKSINIIFTFSLFFTGYICLSFLGFYLFTQYQFLDDRFNDQTIFATHLFTLGFLSSIFTGSFFQLLPVLFGIDLKINKSFVIMFITSLILSLIAFHVGLINGKFSEFKILVIPFIFIFILWFIVFQSSIKALIKQKLLNLKTIHLALALFHLIIGSFIGIIMIMGHSQLISINFRPHLTDIHITILLVGFLISLIYLIAKNVIPMFFISDSAQNYGIGLIIFYLLLYQKIIAIIINNELYNYTSTILLTLIILAGILDILNTFRKRKRKRKNATINLWYLGIFIILIALFIAAKDIDNINSNFLLQKIFFISLKVIISAMLVKIIPFLFWLNLSFIQQKNMSYSIAISNINDFFAENNIKLVFIFQVIILILALTAKKWLGIGLITESIYIIYLFIKSYKLFNSNITKLGTKNEY